jgi:chaperone required for assembly of F1-ATPase
MCAAVKKESKEDLIMGKGEQLMEEIREKHERLTEELVKSHNLPIVRAAVRAWDAILEEVIEKL